VDYCTHGKLDVNTDIWLISKSILVQ